MLIMLVNLICVSPSTIFQLYIQSKTVPMRHPGRYILFTSVLLSGIWLTNNYLLPNPTPLWDTLTIFTDFLLAWLFAQKGYRLKSLVSMVVYMLAMILANYLVGLAAFPIARSMGYSAEFLVDKYHYANAIMSLICFFPLSALTYLAHLLLKQLWNRPGIFRWLLLFTPIPISQALMLNLLNRVLPLSDQFSAVSLALILAAAFCFAVDVSALIAIRKLQQAEQLKAQLQLTEEQLNAQTAYYRNLQDNLCTINQIRDDLDTQLQSAYRMLESGSSEQVRRQLDILQDRIQRRMGPRYCSNLMVDAVLAEKVHLCLEQHIHLDINANLPSQLPIENAHLCSAFSNLLDNSIQGALASHAAKKEIRLRASVRSACLIIHCVNTAAPPPKKLSRDVLRLHGLGLGILDRLAAQYNGSLEAHYQNGEFDTTLILRFPECEKLP